MAVSESKTSELFSDICTEKRGVNVSTLEQVMLLAIEIAREGREGRTVGTMFVVGDAETTLKHSRPLILDPLWHHPAERKHIQDPDLRETVKELAQLDGAFIVSDEGVVLSACRYVNASSEDIKLPLGLGSRHMAAASITRATNAVAVVVSKSAVLRVFDDGEMIAEILPELWLLKRHGLDMAAPYSTRTSQEMAVVSKEE